MMNRTALNCIERNLISGGENKQKEPLELVSNTVILTDILGTPGQFWGDNTTYQALCEPSRLLGKIIGKALSRRISELVSAWRMFRRRSSVDAYITSGTLCGNALACLQTLFPWGRKPHVLVDCIWYTPKNSVRKLIDYTMYHLAAQSVTKYIVWASHEVEDYAKTFHLDQKLFHYVHFWHTLSGYEFHVRDEGYVFAGGNWDRDFPTVLKAAKRLPDIPFIIGTTRPEQLNGHEISPNVAVKGYTHEGFRQAIASCRVMLVPMMHGLLHSGGQQTVLNAMYMGKPTIAFGERWAKDLIDDGKNGFIVDYGDCDGLVSRIDALYANEELRHEVGALASEEASSWPPERSLRMVYDIATCMNASISGVEGYRNITCQ